MKLDHRLAALAAAFLSAPMAATPAEICHDYTGTVTWIGRSDYCDAHPVDCAAHASIAPIQTPPGPAIGMVGPYDYPGDTDHYTDELHGHPFGSYTFAVGGGGGYIGPAGPVGSSTCVPVAPESSCINSMCSGSFSAELYRGDEPPELQGICSATGGPSPNVGLPVNVMNGNAWFTHTDTSIPGLGGGLQFVRAYNSKAARMNFGGIFGLGWTHTYEKTITLFPPAVLKVRDASGVVFYYQDDDGDSTYQPMLPKVQTTWIVKAGTTYARYFREGGSETYDQGTGALLSLADANGNTTTLARDPSGRLITVTEASGRSLTLSYDVSGKIVGLTGPLGLIASFAYDGNARLAMVRYPDGSGYGYAYGGGFNLIVSVTDASGKVLEAHAYDSSGMATTSELADGQEKLTIAYGVLQATVTDALGNTTVYQWTNLRGNTQRITKITGPCASCGGGGGTTQEWTYDDLGRVLTHKDGLGHLTSYAYDASSNLTSVTDALNHTTTYTHDTQGRVTSVTGPDTATTITTYAPAGPLTITDPISRVTTFTYNGQGKVTAVTDPRNKTTSLGYNAAGDLVTVTDPLSHVTTFGYDALGRRTTVTDALSHTTTTTYDARGRVTRVTSHDGTHTDFTYDLSGHRTSVRDPMGRTTYSIYGTYGRLTRVVNPAGGVTSYTYDLMGNLTSLTDAKGQTTNFAYDAYNQVSAVTYPGGASETYGYDAAGRLATRTDRKGVVTTYSYDVLGRLTGKTYSDGTTPPISYTYDTVGRLLTASNGTDTLGWGYDLAGQLLSETSTKNSSIVSYTYDNGGNRLTLSLDGTLYVSYAYDDASRLTGITRGSNVFGFSYDAANRRMTMTYPNGVNTGNTYDALNRLIRLKADKGATPITDFQYTYDAAANRTRKQQLDYTEDYAYDALYQLTGVERSAGLTGSWRYAYDTVGNRLTEQQDGTVLSASFNEKNQLLSRTPGGMMRWRGSLNEPGNVTFTSVTVNGLTAWMLPGNVFEADIPTTVATNMVAVQATDMSGNVATKGYQVNLTGIEATYAYDLNGNLSQKDDGTDTWTYEWNAENQLTRVLKNALDVAHHKYDALGRRIERVAAATTTRWTYDGERIIRDVAGTVVTKTIHGPGIDEPLLQEGPSGATTYLHADGLQGIAATTDATGGLVASHRYEVFGTSEAMAPDRYGYTGREWDAGIGLYYYRARYYDPLLGLFLSEDPIGGNDEGRTLYAYADNKPTTLTDPYGLQPIALQPPSVAYYICCKGGRMTYCPGNAPVNDKCLSDCVAKHEEGHMKDLCDKGFGDYCKGRPDSPVFFGGPGNPPATIAKWSECKQNKASWRCIKKCPDSPEKTRVRRGVGLAIWDNCGKGPRPPW